MRHLIIGTAGHVDHGKTALIRALTGVDTDRLKEEQERGITIDLGFTGFELPGGIQAGIVDVPGHEHFINNMLAGVVGMDLVLLVVAADEGICAQTLEHLDILKLSGIREMIVVLTKWDKVEEKDRPFVKARLERDLQKTWAAGMPVCAVSSLTGEGLEELRERICRVAGGRVIERDPYAVPRLPIDRFFQVKGAGSVVTGTLIGGQLKRGEEICLYPSGIPCRIRNIQVHNRDVESCTAGQRTALNLTGIKPGQIRRGEVAARKGSLAGSYLADVRLSVLPSSSRSILSGMRFHLFIGTAHLLCRVLLLERDELKPGESGLAQLRGESTFVAMKNDRFVLRFYSPMETMAGGVILDSHPSKHAHLDEIQQRRLNQLEKGFFASLEYYMAEQVMVSARMAARTLGVREEALLQEWKEQGMPVYKTDSEVYLCHPDRQEELEQRVLDQLSSYAQKYPYRTGMNRAEVAGKALAGIPQAAADLFLSGMEEAMLIQTEYGKLALHGHRILKDEAYNRVMSTLNNSCRKAGLAFMKAEQFRFDGVKSELVKELLAVAVETGKLLRLEEDYYTIPAVMEPVLAYIREYLKENEEISIIQLREGLGVSRKNAKLIFAYTDRMRLTRDTGAQSMRKRYI